MTSLIIAKNFKETVLDGTTDASAVFANTLMLL